jgi:ribosomal protein L37E
MTNEEHVPSEGILLEELYSLVRYIYRKKLAEEIITAFNESLAAHENADERLGIILHWIDFYRAHKYRKLMRRRRSTAHERVTPCSACGYPISHRHHLWDLATHGENQVTVQLCANCHELHHLMYNALARDSAHSRRLVQHVLFSGKFAPDVGLKILGWCKAILQYEIDNNWLESYKLSDLWIENQLRWSEFLGHSQTSV